MQTESAWKLGYSIDMRGRRQLSPMELFLFVLLASKFSSTFKVPTFLPIATLNLIE